MAKRTIRWLATILVATGALAFWAPGVSAHSANVTTSVDCFNYYVTISWDYLDQHPTVSGYTGDYPGNSAGTITVPWGGATSAGGTVSFTWTRDNYQASSN
ncbi:MAG TPA: hypothetical protein VFQ54_10050, partial [Thermomicrobiales bacterium]|nr:hypothetical protein [Thermomicrobiales bacterium]